MHGNQVGGGGGLVLLLRVDTMPLRGGTSATVRLMVPGWMLALSVMVGSVFLSPLPRNHYLVPVSTG